MSAGPMATIGGLAWARVSTATSIKDAWIGGRGGCALDDLTYEVISWLAGGHTVFRPREATRESEESFRPVVALLAQLRERGWVHYLEGHVSQTAGGIYLMVGPVQLTEPGKAALERDRRLGARPPRTGDPLPWRT
jgi:hypothetical protein